jgi:hypothetical protein
MQAHGVHGSPVKESSILQRETSVDDIDKEQEKEEAKTSAPKDPAKKDVATTAPAAVD